MITDMETFLIIFLCFLVDYQLGRAASNPSCFERAELRASVAYDEYTIKLKPFHHQFENETYAIPEATEERDCLQSSTETISTIDIGLDGLAMTVIDQRSAKSTLYKVFPLNKFWVHWSNLIWIVKNIPCGRVIVFGLVGDGSVGLRSAKAYLSSLGSVLALHILHQTNWIWAYVQCGATLLETASMYSQPPLNVSLVLPLSTDQLPPVENEKQRLRRKICEDNEMLGDLCDQTDPAIPHFTPPVSVQFENLENIPVIITAGGRLHYFYFTLKTLLQTPGIDRQKITVIVGGEKKGFINLLNLLEINFTTLKMYGEGNGMLFQYYRRVYKYISEHFPSSPAAILIDEDVEVSPDFFHYMNQTIPLLEKDPTIYCINSHSTARGNRLFGDPARVLRATSQVTWGYAISLKLIKRAVALWPTNPRIHTLFDAWVMENITDNGECVFPEQTRSVHFGIDGQNYGDSSANEVFSIALPLVESYGVLLSNLEEIPLENWTYYLTQEINSSQVLTGSPCRSDFMPPNATGSYSFFFSWETFSQKDAASYVMAGMCLGLWALSDQGLHDRVASFRPRMNSILHMVAVPVSNFSYLKPPDVIPWNYITLNESDKSRALQFKDDYYSAKGYPPILYAGYQPFKVTYESLFNR